ncbi:hypothetical protein E0493_19490 [Roseomonas sp. M0104]|uniref:Uncharacterized protein n=1 Tax=Teichococcus coralli TaxID=2545983 RepID=A0A845BEY8_9PROT|nr:hypothetical protein [Pseudoroseomonas coralli]MXP65535.1 hypothetical protein [Pseudoroseomonas coralli]
MSAEAVRQEEPGWGELITLMGWPWKLALALVVCGPALLWTSPSGFVDPGLSTWNGGAALACIAAAAVIALGGSLHALRALLRRAAEEPSLEAAEAQDLVRGLRQLLEQQQQQVHEATGAASRAVATAAQLSGLAGHVEKQFRQTLEQASPAAALMTRPDHPERGEAEARLARLEASARQVEAAAESLLAPSAVLRQMEEGILRLQQGAAEATGMLQAFPAAAERLEASVRVLDALPDSTRPLILAAQALTEQGDAARRQSEQTRQQLEVLVHGLGGHVERVLRNEATLGDAARYLTETTDRFAGGLAALESHAVRLQAMISIAGNREMEAAPLHEALATLRQQAASMAELTESLEMLRHRLDDARALPAARHVTLEQLGMMEADAAQLLQEAAAMPQQPLPPAFASRAAKLLQAMQENIRHLHAAAGGTPPTAA